jgi:6-phosphogluconolactonase
MDRIIKIFSTPQALAESVALDLVDQIEEIEEIEEAGKRIAPFTIALSGGSTPKLLFSVLGDQYASSVNWNNVHFFWVDERCVPPEDNESNFGMTNEALLSKINIPHGNVHRIKGEEDPEAEAERYSKEVNDFVRHKNGLPCFNVILLGLGEDGHTASIFPGNLKLFKSEKISEMAVNPLTGQKRITLTGKVINNSENIYFLVTGKSKVSVVKSILHKEIKGKQYPALYVLPEDGRLFWYLDNDAVSLIEERSVKK